MRGPSALAVLALLVLPGVAASGAPFDLVAVLGVPPFGTQRYGEENAVPSALPPGTFYFESAVPLPCNGDAAEVVLRPMNGVWTFPVHVVRNYQTLGYVEDHTGSASPLRLRAHCEQQVLRSDDLLVLLMGQVSSGIEATVTLKVGGTVFSDRDVYLAP